MPRPGASPTDPLGPGIRAPGPNDGKAARRGRWGAGTSSSDELKSWRGRRAPRRPRAIKARAYAKTCPRNSSARAGSRSRARPACWRAAPAAAPPPHSGHWYARNLHFLCALRKNSTRVIVYCVYLINLRAPPSMVGARSSLNYYNLCAERHPNPCQTTADTSAVTLAEEASPSRVARRERPARLCRDEIEAKVGY